MVSKQQKVCSIYSASFYILAMFQVLLAIFFARKKIYIFADHFHRRHAFFTWCHLYKHKSTAFIPSFGSVNFKRLYLCLQEHTALGFSFSSHPKLTKIDNRSIMNQKLLFQKQKTTLQIMLLVASKFQKRKAISNKCIKWTICKSFNLRWI